MSRRKKTVHRASKNDYVLRVLAPERFGFESVETVRCFICGKPQERMIHIQRDGKPHSIRCIEGHHIISAHHDPELAHCPENYMFMCRDHHKGFHRQYDTSEWRVNPKFNPKVRIKPNNQPQNLHNIPGTLEDLQEYLGLTAKETIAHQFEWSEQELIEADVVRGFFFTTRELDNKHENTNA